MKRVAQGRSPRRAPRTACGRCDKLTHKVDGELRIVSDPPLIVPIEELLPAGDEPRPRARSCSSVLDAYRETLPADRRHLLDGYSFRHIARKVVGVGSVGTRAWVVLLTGRDDGDPLFLQAKEAEASVLEPYAGAQPLPQPRPAGGRGPAADAGGQRHLPRLVPGGRPRRPRPRLLRAPALGLEGLGRRRDA